jgi:hypothetical protein
VIFIGVSDSFRDHAIDLISASSEAFVAFSKPERSSSVAKDLAIDSTISAFRTMTEPFFATRSRAT